MSKQTSFSNSPARSMCSPTKPLDTSQDDTGRNPIRLKKLLNRKPEQTAEQYQKKQFEELVKRVTFCGEQYKYGRTAPNVTFYKFLAKKPEGTVRQLTSKAGKLKLWIPDTIVFNDGNPMWLYSSVEGYVYRTETFIDQHILTKIGNMENKDELVAVVKRSGYDNHSGRKETKTIALSTNDLIKRLSEFTQGQQCCIQKYVKSSGPKAFVVRMVYQRDSRPYCWILTNKVNLRSTKVDINERCVTTIGKMRSCTAVQAKSGKYLEQIMPHMKDIISFTENNMKIKFEELVADFLKDDTGTWWFAGVKAFRMVEGHDEPVLRHFVSEGMAPSEHGSDMEEKTMLTTEYQKLKRCRLCQIAYPMTALTHEMTLKMINETDTHLRSRGIMIKWLDRAEYKHCDMATIYQSYRVCKNCYRLYELTEEMRELVYKFSVGMGIPVKSQKPIEVKPGVAMPDDWEFQGRTEKPVMIINDVPTGGVEISDAPTKKLSLFRMIVILQEICEVPNYFPKNGHYSLEYSIFNCTQKYKINAKPYLEQKLPFIPVNKIRLFHFYGNTRKSLKEYLTSTGKLKIQLTCNNELVGNAECELKDFNNPIVIKKEYYEMFSGIEIRTAYLKAQVGIVEGEKEDVQNIKLKAHKGIFVPPEDYTYSATLPEEWLEMLPNLTEYKQQMQRQHGIEPMTTRTSPSQLISRPFTNASSPRVANQVSSVRNSRPRSQRRSARHYSANRSFSIRRRRPRSANRRSQSFIKNNRLYQSKVPIRKLSQKLDSINQSLSSGISPTNAEASGPVWNFIITIHAAVGMEETGSAWKVIFDVFGSKYTGEEYTRRDDAICFNLVKSLNLLASETKLRKALQNQAVIVKIYKHEVLGSVVIPLNGLETVGEIRDEYPIEFNTQDKEANLCVTLSLERDMDPIRSDMHIIREISKGVDMVKL